MWFVLVVDFEQPRALVTKVMDDTAREHLVENIAGHLGNVKTTRIKELQRMYFPASLPTILPSHERNSDSLVFRLYSVHLCCG
jgi:hypothetical protein